MQPVRVVTDVGECRQLWQTLIPQEQVFDLWEVRYCFHEQYRHAPIFLVCEDHTGISGFLPLSRNGETGTYQYFPGETWQGKTWLEQNRIIARDRETARSLLAAIPGPFHLRYLQPTLPVQDAAAPCDEIGYIFIPAHYDYTMERYFEQFSHKTGKRLRRELAGWKGTMLPFVMTTLTISRHWWQ